MPLPTIEGTTSIDRYACEYFWTYTESTSVAGVTVRIEDGATVVGGPVAASAGTDPNGVAGWKVLVAGPLCTTPGSAMVMPEVKGYTWRSWQTDAPETHAYTGRIRVT